MNEELYRVLYEKDGAERFTKEMTEDEAHDEYDRLAESGLTVRYVMTSEDAEIRASVVKRRQGYDPVMEG